jgi:bacteriorhodopsin
MADMTPNQFNLVYDVLSFSLATMMATTIFCWMRVRDAAPKYRSALVITGLVTFIAAYHYMRIFNSWVEAYEWDGSGLSKTNVPFNDAYRYMDWLLTVPLLLIEIILVMNLDDAAKKDKGLKLGVSSALMIIIGYPGELVLDADNLGTRWVYWGLAMLPFLYIVKELLVGLAEATESEADADVKGKIKLAQVATVISWCTYPVVYIFPMLGISGSSAIVAIQLGYSASDIISKCGVGLLVYSITMAKSKAISAEEAPLLA